MTHQIQTIFPITSDQRYKESDFIISPSNAHAYHVITNWPNLWGVHPYARVLLLLGPKYSGKTFLSKIWQNIEMQTNLSMPNGNRTANHNNSKIIYEDVDLLDKGQEEELLHIINSSNESEKYLLLTASRFPKYSLKDLVSRINAINIVRISPPDDELLAMLIFKLFSDNAVKISTDIVKYMIKVLPRDFLYVKNITEQINKEALIKGKRVTIPFIKTILDTRA